MTVPDAIVDRVRESTDIVEVIGAVVELKRAGTNLKGLCPFHSEKTPSFIVSPAKQLYHCFGCGQGGNVFTFLMETEKLSFAEALERLAERAGIELPRTGPAAGESDKIYAALEYARTFYKSALAAASGAEARQYMQRRGLRPQTAEDFSLGYAPDEWSAFANRAVKVAPPEVLEKAGLIIKKTGYYDRFRHRFMIPIVSPAGRTVAFGARALAEKDSPKYLNSPETPVYRKGSVLFGLPQARAALRESGELLLVEGYMDVMSLHEAGFANAVGCCGTALTPDQVRLARRFAPKIVLLFDGDAAGVAAARRSLATVLAEGVSASVVLLPAGTDPDAFVRSKGAEAMGAQIASRLDPVEFVETLQRSQASQMSVEDALHTLRDLLAVVRDPIVRRLLVQRASERFRFDEAVLAAEVERTARGRGPSPAPPVRSQSPRSGAPSASMDRVLPEGSERDLLVSLMLEPALLGDVGDLLREMNLSPGMRQAVERLLEWHAAGAAGAPGQLLDGIEDPGVRSTLSEVALWDSEGYTEREKAHAVQAIRHWIKTAGRQQRIRHLTREIAQISKGAPGDMDALVQELTRLQREVHAPEE